MPSTGSGGGGSRSGASSRTTQPATSAARRRGLSHVAAPPPLHAAYTPRTNGKAERFTQNLLQECAYRRPYRSSYERTGALARYLRFYDHRRLHASLARRSPWTRLLDLRP